MKAPDASAQVAFHQLLIGARRTWPTDALHDALLSVDPIELKNQLATYSSTAVRPA